MYKLLILSILFLSTSSTAFAQAVIDYSRPSGNELPSPVSLHAEMDTALMEPLCEFHQMAVLYLEPPFYLTAKRVLQPMVSTSTPVLDHDFDLPLNARIINTFNYCYPSSPIEIGTTGAPPAGGNQLDTIGYEGDVGGAPSTHTTLFQIITSGFRMMGVTSRDSSNNELQANVGGAVGSLYPIWLSIIGIFVAFYVIQYLMFLLGQGEEEKKNKRRRKR